MTTSAPLVLNPPLDIQEYRDEAKSRALTPKSHESYVHEIDIEAPSEEVYKDFVECSLSAGAGKPRPKRRSKELTPRDRRCLEGRRRTDGAQTRGGAPGQGELGGGMRAQDWLAYRSVGCFAVTLTTSGRPAPAADELTLTGAA